MPQLTKNQLESQNQSSFPNNTSNFITPQALREFNTDMIQSTVNQTIYTADSASFSQRITQNQGVQGIQGVQGSQGVQGVSGSQGIQGVQGSDATVQGIQGSTGIQGIQGIQGLQGIQGTQSTQGTTGAQGYTGNTGNVGSTGAQGIQGIQGIQGLDGQYAGQGVQGTQGIQGITGAQGIQGSQGSQGTQGIQGETGTQGAQGIQGSQGTQGVQGITGAQGSSNISVLNQGSILGNATSFDFTGSGVTTTLSAGTASITIAGGSSIDTGSFATTGSNSFVGNQTITGSLTISGSSTTDLIITGSAEITTEDKLARLVMSPNSFNLDTSKTISTPGEGYIFGPTGSNASFYLGVYDQPNFTTDVELKLKVDSNGLSFNDWDNGTAFDYVPFMTLAPNVGNNPAPVMTRGLKVTGSVDIQNTLTASLAQGFTYVGNAAGRTTLVATSSFGTSIDTGSFATTGSNTFVGNQTISGSAIITGSLVVTGSITERGDNIYLVNANQTLPFNITQSAGGTNLIFGWNGDSTTVAQSQLTGSFSITGSNNIILTGLIGDENFSVDPGFRAYLSGSNNILYGVNTIFNGILINSSSVMLPKMDSNILAGYVNLGFTTSSLAKPTFSNNLIAGNNTSTVITHPSGSLNMTGNLGNRGLASTANKTTLGLLTAIQNNVFIGGASTTLNHNSSSISYTGNIGTITVTNNYSSSTSTAVNNVTVQNNTFLGTSNSLLISGSNTSARRTFTSNLVAGRSNIISSEYTGSSVGHLVSTAVIGQELIVSASGTSTTVGGGAFFGRYNDVTNMYADSGKMVFAVGTGTGTSARKTALSVDSSSVVNVSGSLSVTGSSTFNGTLSVTSSNFSINSGNVTASTILITSSPGFPGGVTITGSLSVSGSTTLSGSLKISASSDIVLNGTLTITGSGLSIDSSANITASAFTALQGNTKAFSYQAASSGGVNGTFNTALGRDYLDIYQYQGQAYAFAMHLTSDQLNTYSGSQFNFQLQTNGNGVSLPDGGATYFAMVSASYSSSVGPGTQVPGLDVLGTAMFLDMKARTTFEQKVYMDKSLYVSGGAGGGTPALTINTNGGDALKATGSVIITGSLNLNGQTGFASLESNTFTNTQIVSSSIYIAPNSNSNQLYLPSGSNKQTGLATLDGGNPGAVVVSNTNVTANSIIMLTKQTLTNAHMVAVSSKGSNTFTITSNGNGDADVVAFMIINPS